MKLNQELKEDLFCLEEENKELRRTIDDLKEMATEKAKEICLLRFVVAELTFQNGRI